MLDSSEGQIVDSDDVRGLNLQVALAVGPGRYYLQLGAYISPHASRSIISPFRMVVWTRPSTAD